MSGPASATTRLLVVIVNYRTAGLTIDCLASLEQEVAQLGSVRVIVTDNGSGDGSAERIAQAIAERGWGRWAELIALPHNLGYSAGNNAGIRPALQQSPPEYVLLLNSDTVVRPSALTELLRFMDAHPDVGIAGSRLEDPDGTQQHSRFRFPSLLSELDSGLRLGLFTKLVKHKTIAPDLVDEAHPADWVAGASMIIRRLVIDEIGLLDDEYFLYYEELDYCLQARRAGWTCWYVPQSRVVHLVGQSTGITVQYQRPDRRPRYWWEARYRYFRKNHGRIYAALTDVAWSLGFASFRLRQWLQRKPDIDPPFLLTDFLRFRLHPTRRTGGRPAGGR